MGLFFSLNVVVEDKSLIAASAKEFFGFYPGLCPFSPSWNIIKTGSGREIKRCPQLIAGHPQIPSNHSRRCMMVQNRVLEHLTNVMNII
jgi:hypothetical protein